MVQRQLFEQCYLDAGYCFTSYMQRHRFSEQEKADFVRKIIQNYNRLFPEDEIGPSRDPNYFRFYTRYFMRYGSGFGLTETKQEAKRLQDMSHRFYRDYYLQQFCTLRNSGMSANDAKNLVIDQAKMWMMPWQIKRLCILMDNHSIKKETPKTSHSEQKE